MRPLKLDRVFIALLVLQVAANLPFLSDSFLPRSDSVMVFTRFYYFYNQLFFTGEIPYWLAYGVHGMRSLVYELLGFTPFTGAMTLVGLLFRVTNVYHLYKISVLLEQMFLLFGMYVFCKMVFKRRATTFLVCLFTIGITLWFKHINFDFREGYYLPLAIALLIRFFREENPVLLWVAGLVCIIYSAVYMIFMDVYVLLFVFVILAVHSPSALKSIFRISPANILTFTALCAVTAVYGLCWLSCREGVATLVPGRSGLAVGLEYFLFWGPFRTHAMLSDMFTGWVHPGYIESSFYVGLLPLFCIFYALPLARRDVTLRAVLAATGALFFLSVGGTFAMIAYSVPPMFMYRHINLVSGAFKVLLLMASGFGVERLLDQLSERDRPVPAGTILLCLFGTWVLLEMFLGRGLATLLFQPNSVPDKERMFLLVGLARYGTYLAAILVFWGLSQFKVGRGGHGEAAVRAFVLAAVTAGVLDCTVYRYTAWWGRLQLPNMGSGVAAMSHVFPLGYSPNRTLEPGTSRQEAIHSVLFHETELHNTYVTTYFVSQYDAAYPVQRANMFPKATLEMFRARGYDIKPPASYGLVFNPNDEAMHKMTGWKAPKLRTLVNVSWVESSGQALDMVRSIGPIDRTLVLTKPQEQLEGKDVNLPDENPGTATMVQFSANRAVVKAQSHGDRPTWLVYADTYDPLWRATVNGRKVPVYEAYGAYKAVLLETGENTVVFTFRQNLLGMVTYWVYGVVWSVAGLSAILCALWAAIFSGTAGRRLYVSSGRD